MGCGGLLLLHEAVLPFVFLHAHNLVLGLAVEIGVTKMHAKEGEKEGALGLTLPPGHQDGGAVVTLL